MRERIENLKKEVEKTKRMPLLQKAGQAERVTGQAVVLLEIMAERIEALEESARLPKQTPTPVSGGVDYFGTDAAWEAHEKAGLGV